MAVNETTIIKFKNNKLTYLDINFDIDFKLFSIDILKYWKLKNLKSLSSIKVKNWLWNNFINGKRWKLFLYLWNNIKIWCKIVFLKNYKYFIRLKRPPKTNQGEIEKFYEIL